LGKCLGQSGGFVWRSRAEAFQAGAVIERQYYDPWGKRRNGDGTDADTLRSLDHRMGYTGHEHLDAVGLVHMNGRVYDPMLARFMSADPTVPDPTDGQNFNRFTYVLNNPLGYIDPSGFAQVREAELTMGSTVGAGWGGDFGFSTSSKSFGWGWQTVYLRSDGDDDSSGCNTWSGCGRSDPEVNECRHCWNAGAAGGTKSNSAEAQTILDKPSDRDILSKGPCSAPTKACGQQNADYQAAFGRVSNAQALPLSTPDLDLALGVAGLARAAVAVVATRLVAREAPAATEALAGVAATGGRLGSQTTRQHIDDVATEMEMRGWTITHGGGPSRALKEEYLPGPGGARKGSSYPDITATKNGRTLRVNTVDTRADGITPTTREATNAARIRQQTGEHVLLIPKP
jgi:RHS repeat-associated protein